MNLIAIIPAKERSTRLPGKNIRKLDGKPLVLHSIDVAIESSVFKKIFVSTDSIQIRSMALSAGAEVPFLRPKKLCEDNVRIVEVVKHLFETLPDLATENDGLTLLEPTTPLRNADDIIAAAQIFSERKCNSVVSVTEYGFSPFYALCIDNNIIKPFWNEQYFSKKSQAQNVKKLYHPNGAVTLSKIDFFLQHNKFISEDAIPYYMPRMRSVDIDEEIDFQFAEFLIQNSKKKL